jgi:hypothetical protein
MRRSLVAVVLILAGALPAAAEGITWETDYKAAKERALREGKAIFIELFADW